MGMGIKKIAKVKVPDHYISHGQKKALQMIK